MIGKTKRFYLIVVLAAVCFSGLASARAADEKARAFPVECRDKSARCTTCETYFEKDYTRISCTFKSEDCDKYPVCAVYAIQYQCRLSMSQTPKWTCKGYIPLSNDVRATFTREEFEDDNLRCGKICQPCRSGWQE